MKAKVRKRKLGHWDVLPIVGYRCSICGSVSLFWLARCTECKSRMR